MAVTVAYTNTLLGLIYVNKQWDLESGVRTEWTGSRAIARADMGKGVLSVPRELNKYHNQRSCKGSMQDGARKIKHRKKPGGEQSRQSNTRSRDGHEQDPEPREKEIVASRGC